MTAAPVTEWHGAEDKAAAIRRRLYMGARIRAVRTSLYSLAQLAYDLPDDDPACTLVNAVEDAILAYDQATAEAQR